MPNSGMPNSMPACTVAVPLKPGEIAGARRQQPGFGAMRAAQPEVDQQFAGRHQHHARRLRGDQRLEMQQVDQPRLDQLRLRDRRGDAQDRLVRKKYRAFRHRMHIAGEAQRFETRKEFFR